MFNRIKEIFSSDNQAAERIEPAQAAAVLMFEVVWADHDIAEAELTVMSQLLQRMFGIDAARVEKIHAATRANHDASVGVFPFTRAINEQLDKDAKYDVLKAMWSIALADEQIDAFEEHTIRRIADLLYVPHQRFIEAKLAARSEAAGLDTTTRIRGHKQDS